MWQRPARIEPGPGQESVWDYPRPPALQRVERRVRVELGGRMIVDTTAAWRVCETSHVPAYYLPRADIDDVMVPAAGTSFCEWKGSASYYDVVVGDRRASRAAWSYLQPVPRFAPIAGYVAFYAGQMDRCWVGEAEVRPMDGDLCGGWITPELVGPFKGAPGTRHW